MNSSVKTKQKIEFGDFQTPDVLCLSVCQLLRRLNVSPKTIVEPTCGKGSFLRASASAFTECEQLLGFDINPAYVQEARKERTAIVQCENFFEKDWLKTLRRLHEPLLIIGNPPWVTNSTVGALSGTNLPTKSNFKNLNGLDAVTGKSNFDISEWMISHLLEWLSGQSAVLAMLCKTVVARKVLKHIWSRHLYVKESAIYSIDAAEHFGASVNACLLVCFLEPGMTSKKCAVYSDLDATTNSQFAYHRGQLVADLKSNATYGHLYGASSLKWRSGIKHDCARVMELYPRGNNFFSNGFGETVSLESKFLYPMLKSSELMKSHPTPSRYMLVTQQSVSDNTSKIELEAPQTWSYLQSHAKYLDSRASSIYKNRPRFSVFGIGPYSFSPWKVAISGFYKRLEFRCVGPIHAKSVVLDDTCYFLPCKSEDDAHLVLDVLNSDAAKGFYNSYIFWDAKRPITANILGNLNLELLASELGISLTIFANSAYNSSPIDSNNLIQGRIEWS